MEVCVDSVESAINAELGGATRIELCANLLEGGTTPSLGLLQVVKQHTQLPVFMMIRPRGGDFLYSEHEVEVMRADIQQACIGGADGIVFGALTESGTIHHDICSELLSLSRPLPATFHRAFDMLLDPMQALEELISLGFERLLTSGCENTVLEGLPLIKKLVQQANGRLIVVPVLANNLHDAGFLVTVGGGITERNLQRILEGSGATEFHCSARSARSSGMQHRNDSVRMGASFGPSEYSLKIADPSRISILNNIAKSII